MMPAPPPDRSSSIEPLLRHQLRQAIQASIAEASKAKRHCAVLILAAEPKDRLLLLTQDWVDARIEQALGELPTLLRKVDRYASLGQRQWCVLLPGLTNVAQAVLAAHKISRSLSELLSDQPGKPWARILIGIACHPEHATDADALLIRADAAQRQAEASEDGISVFLPDPAQEDDACLPALRSEVLHALASNSYRLAYQPQIDLASGRCHAAEALLRCTLPNGSRVPPTMLARVAEQEGKMATLTMNVLNSALRQLGEWSSRGIDMRVSVNLSPYNLRDHDLPDVVAGAIASWEIDAQRLTLEIVESSMIHNFDQAASILNRLKALGVKLAVDDFGTGYSCLAYLRQLPVDELKVDQSLVRHMLRSKADRQLVRATIDLAHNFGLHAVAEGVETIEMLEVLSEMRCDTIQGYLISAPIEAEHYPGWLRHFEADALLRIPAFCDASTHPKQQGRTTVRP